MIYRLRVILDATIDCFRDIEIEDTASLEDFHNVIIQSFQLPGDEMASFYKSDDDWNQGQEYCLFDMGEGLAPVQKMMGTNIDAVFAKSSSRMIYIYDFLSMWTFLIELDDIVAKSDSAAYPQVVFSMGVLPDEAQDRSFEADPRFADEDESSEEEYRSNLDDDADFYDEQDLDDNDLY
jgi:hypothetical protein